MLNVRNVLLSAVTMTGLFFASFSIAAPLDLDTLSQDHNANTTAVHDALLADQRPVKVALDACKDKAAGSECSFKGKQGREVQGVCETKRKQNICVPKQHIARRDVCTGKKNGDSCSFKGRSGKTITGTCQVRGNKAACVSDAAKNAAKNIMKACQDKKAGDSCSFKGRNDKTVNGKCVAHRKAMTCKPEKGK